MKAHAISLAFFIIFAMASRANDESTPFIPLPDGIRLTVIGENLKVYGLPLMAYEYFHEDSVDELAEFYRSAWRESSDDSDVEDPYMEMSFGGWKIISRLENGYNITIQIADSGIKGTHVLVGASPLPNLISSGKKNKVDINIPILGDSKLISLVSSVTNVDDSEVYWLETGYSVTKILEKYRKHYADMGCEIKGYRIVNSDSVKAASGLMTIHGLGMTLRIQAMASDDGKTKMVAIRQR